MREVLIIGGGVIGLTTAVVLAEDGARVRLWSRDATADTTSAVAGGLCWPYRIEPARSAVDWALRSLSSFAELAAEPETTGVRQVAGRMEHGWAPAEWTARTGSPPVTPLVDMPTYLRYLRRRLAAAGGRCEERTAHSLREAAEAAPVVVNCTGLGARELVPDPAVRPVRGQVVVVENPGIEEWYVSADPGSADPVYILPQPYGVILGGTAQDGAESLVPDPATAETIVARCAAVHPALADAAVLEHRAGLRPYRPAVRLERETLPGGGVCVHHYGHGGAGITVSWGCARDAAALVRTSG